MLLFTAIPALAVETGIVRGVITQSGTPTAGATVTLTRAKGTTSLRQPTHAAQYSFPRSVPFGHYLLTVHVNGATDRTADSRRPFRHGRDGKSRRAQDDRRHRDHRKWRASAARPSPLPPSTTTQIQTSPVRDSLNRLIETVPGIVQFSYNEPVANGFHGITYEIDGAPLPLATTSNFAEIVDPKYVNSLEVLTGAIPAEYGGDRMGAVVNIITDRFEDIPEGTYGTITGGAGNQAQAHR